MMCLYVLKNNAFPAGKATKNARRKDQSHAFIKYCVCEFSGEKDIKIVRDGNGKPKIAGGKLNVSLSHSGDYVICAVSSHNIGVDIEKYRDIDYAPITKRFFSQKERLAIGNTKDFFEIWTRKESYLKYTGIGLNTHISQVCVLSLPVYFYSLNIAEGYICSLCAEQKQEIRIVKVFE